MRIIAGKYRGRKLFAPSGRAVRPSSDRLRQALFNILEQGKHDIKLGGATVVDVFAGTGALGLEALSRGANHAVFIENNPAVLEYLRKNVTICDEVERVNIIHANASSLPPAYVACDIAFLDPPYRSALGVPSLLTLANQGWLKPRCVCTLEIAKAEQFLPPRGFEIIDERTYGAARVYILRWSDRLKTTSSIANRYWKETYNDYRQDN
jgi:16S rRNA (guanine966-N2)-methyltransferase